MDIFHWTANLDETRSEFEIRCCFHHSNNSSGHKQAIPSTTELPIENAKLLYTTMSFSGEYSDPNHPGCKRTIEQDGTTAILSGTDTPDGEIWTVTGSVDGATIVVDFSPKGGPKDLTGQRVPEGIRWEDGNLWTLVGQTESSRL